MKLAAAFNIENDSINEYFEETKYFIIYEIENNQIDHSEVVGTMNKDNEEFADLLLFLEVDALICGKINGRSIRRIENEGISLYAGCFGDADSAAYAFLDGKLVFN